MNPKKILTAAVLGLLTLVSLSACTLDEDTDKKQGNTATETKTEENKTETEAKVDIEENKDNSVTKSTDEVDFIKPAKLDSKKVLANYLPEMQKILAGDAAFQNDDFDDEEYLLTALTFYEVGTMKVAPYEGNKLLVMDVTCEGPCMSASLSRLAWNEQSGELTLLENYSYTDYIADYQKPLYDTADRELRIKALELPNSIMLPDGSNSIQLKSRDFDLQTEDKVTKDNSDGIDFADLGKVAFKDPKVGEVYLSEGITGCLFVINADGTVANYTFDPDLTGDKSNIMAKWIDGSDSTWLGNDYELKTGGCGIGSHCYIIENVDTNLLVEAGKSSNGIKLYLAKDQQRVSDNDALEALVDKNQPLWDLNYTYNLYVDLQDHLTDDQKADQVKTYEEFLASKPIIYWQDPFGRFSGIINTEYKPPAECGKPVIYLYPEKTTGVSVKVGIDEFTVTVPDYGNGWNVIAQPDGELTNLADGNKYEYLFWEGKSDRKLELSGGSVVAKADLEGFLNESLNQLGLNEKEAADFREFWLPKMQATAEPYVLVSFVGTHEFNKIAPLDISPKPDTLLRVFMYYQPLATKISMPAQVLKAPARRGFTVVEWGGTSSDGWQIK